MNSATTLPLSGMSRAAKLRVMEELCCQSIPRIDDACATPVI